VARPLNFSSDATNFYYKYTRELLKGGQTIKPENMGGDDPAGSSVILLLLAGPLFQISARTNSKSL